MNILEWSMLAAVSYLFIALMFPKTCLGLQKMSRPGEVQRFRVLAVTRYWLLPIIPVRSMVISEEGTLDEVSQKILHFSRLNE